MEKIYDINYYDYNLQEELIAQSPLEDRSSSKLLLLDKNTGKIKDETFKNMFDFNYVNNLTIGQIMELCQKYSPYIISRYKGLGEMNKYEMYKFAMNPNYRRLIRYTVSDVQRFEDTLDTLFLKNLRGRRERKNLVQTAQLSLDDIDN